jgi:hypothetical protein
MVEGRQVMTTDRTVWTHFSFGSNQPISPDLFGALLLSIFLSFCGITQHVTIILVVLP